MTLKNDVKGATSVLLEKARVKQRSLLQLYNVGEPMERVAIDVLGPLPYILIAMDYFSKWPKAYALPNQEAVTVAGVLVSQFFSQFGVPGELHFDQGRNFGIVRVPGGMHPARDQDNCTTSTVRRHSGALQPGYRSPTRYIFQNHQRDWDRHLPLLLMSYRSAVYETTKFTSAMLMFGRELHVPLHLLIGRSQEKPKDSGYPEYVERLRESVETVHNFACVHQQESSLRMKRRYDMHLPLKVWILYGFTIPKQRRASRQNRDGHRRSHTLLWNGLMMLCTGFSGVLGKSPKWYTENAFGSTLG